jgi:hypothetical protein
MTVRRINGICEYGAEYGAYRSPEIKIIKKRKRKKGILQSFKPE